MQKWLFVLCLLVSTVGCQNPNITILGPEAFKKHFSGPVTAPVKAETNETSSVTNVKIVAPGMVLSVAVAQDPSLNKYYTVPPSGMVDFSGAGRINVTGLTVEEVAKKIREPLERDFFQKAEVSVTIETAPPAGAVAPAAENGGGVIYVLGAVNRPGPLALPPNQVFTLAKTIISAGGFTQFGDGTKVRLIRYNEAGHKFETRVNVTRILKNGEFEKDIPVQNGDWVIVSEKWISF